MTDILVLGGTAWLSGEIARTAVRHGHRVTCFARGSAAFPGGVQERRGDRAAGDYRSIVDERFDAVVDVARQPGQVASALEELQERGGNWVFVSSGSVYTDAPDVAGDEGDALLPAAGDDVVTDEQYGEGKVACERHFTDRHVPVAVLRAGLIGGPGDPSDRLGYWPAAFARAVRGSAADLPVAVPDALDQPVQVVNVRDIADFAVAAATSGTVGTFDVTGTPTTLGAVIDLARTAAGHDGTVTPVAPQALLDAGVQYWSGPRSMPLWLPADHALTTVRPATAAAAHGLRRRPLGDTVVDVLRDEVARGLDRPRRSGMTRAEEDELLR